MTAFSFTVHASNYGAEIFAPGAFDNSIGKPIKVNAESGRSVDGIVRAVEVSDDGTVASITVEVAGALQYLDTSLLRHAPLDVAYAPPRPFPFGPGPDRFTVTTKCDCSHSITNHLTGQCDVCPCQRSAANIAVKLNIEE